MLCLLVGGEGVEHDVQAQNDQQDSQDQLQAVGDEHSAPGGLTGRDGDSSGTSCQSLSIPAYPAVIFVYRAKIRQAS